MTDRDVHDALARSFLADLPAEVTARLRAEGERADYPAGTTVYRAGDEPRAALVVRGLIRVYLSSPEGRLCGDLRCCDFSRQGTTTSRRPRPGPRLLRHEIHTHVAGAA